MIGETVYNMKSGEVGIVIGEANTVKDVFRVNVWKDNKNDYKVKVFRREHLMIVNDKDIPRSTNLNDPTACRWYKDAALELSVASKDRSWFEEVAKMETEF